DSSLACYLAEASPQTPAGATGSFISRSDWRTVVPRTAAAPSAQALRKAKETPYDTVLARNAKTAGLRADPPSPISRQTPKKRPRTWAGAIREPMTCMLPDVRESENWRARNAG